MRIPQITFTIAALLIALGLGVFGLRHSAAQDRKPPSLPLPEMQRLSKLYVGRWEYTETYPKRSGSANEHVNHGIYTSELGPGGNSIFNHFHSHGRVGDFDGTLVMTYDPKEKVYKAFAFGDSFPGALIETGNWEGDLLVFRSELSVGNSKVTLRNTTKFSDDKIVSDEFSQPAGRPETLLVHVEAIKK